MLERYGETVIALALTSAYGPSIEELRPVYLDSTMRNHAAEWLTERSDAHERREDRLETVEWAILVFLIVSVALDLLLLRK